MKKTELKVGVEYACLSRPARGRRSQWAKPFKAKLIGIDFSEQRAFNKRVGYGSQEILSFRTESGIAVEVEGEKVTRKGTPPKFDATGHRYLSRKDERGATIYEVGPEETHEYPYLLLENAGCFISTWEEYEESQRKAAAAQAQRNIEAHNEAVARTEAAPAIQARVDAFLDLFADVSLRYPSWGDTTKPTSFEAYERRVVGDFHYGDGVDGKVITGITVKTSLSGIESIIARARRNDGNR